MKFALACVSFLAMAFGTSDAYHVSRSLPTVLVETYDCGSVTAQPDYEVWFTVRVVSQPPAVSRAVDVAVEVIGRGDVRESGSVLIKQESLQEVIKAIRDIPAEITRLGARKAGSAVLHTEIADGAKLTVFHSTRNGKSGASLHVGNIDCKPSDGEWKQILGTLEVATKIADEQAGVPKGK